MKLKYSLITRRTFLNTLLFGWAAAFFSGTFYALMKFAFPTLGKEPDFVVLDKKDFKGLPQNSVKPFPWGGTVGLYLKKADGKVVLAYRDEPGVAPASPQTIISSEDELKTAFFRSDSTFGPCSRTRRGDVAPPRSIGSGEVADRPLEVGAVGLGVGTISAYGKAGDRYRFYEIDEAIVNAAHEHFTFVGDSAA